MPFFLTSPLGCLALVDSCAGHLGPGVPCGGGLHPQAVQDPGREPHLRGPLGNPQGRVCVCQQGAAAGRGRMAPCRAHPRERDLADPIGQAWAAEALGVGSRATTGLEHRWQQLGLAGRRRGAGDLKQWSPPQGSPTDRGRYGAQGGDFLQWPPACASKCERACVSVCAPEYV